MNSKPKVLPKKRSSTRAGSQLGCEELEDRRVLAIFTVMNTSDAGAGSLRQAIIDSNAMPGADIVNFAAAVQGQTINLTTQMDPASTTGLLITDDVTIDASAGARVTVAGNDTFRIFKIDDGTATDKVVEFNNLRIQGGNANNETWTSNFANRHGGGIDNREAFTLRNSVVTQNSGRRGGGLSSAGIGDNTRRGSLTVVDSVISENYAQNDQIGTTNTSGGRGGGIAVYNSSPVSITDTIIESNSAASLGAGIDVSLGVTMTMTNSSLRGNSSLEAGAAAYISQFSNATFPTIVTMDNVTITGNSAGSAADSNVIVSVGQRATVTIRNSTIDNNTGNPLRPIFEGSSLTVIDSSISGNTAVGSFFSDAAVSAGQGATATLIRTNVMNNTGMNGVRAISSTLSSVLRIEDSMISGNQYGGITADVYGGATIGSDVEIIDSVISGNGTDPNNSIGGIYARTIYDPLVPDPAGTRLQLTRTTVSGNTVTGGNGGGIHATNFLGINIEDSTINGNQSVPDFYGYSFAGGGLSLNNASATITRSTISNNSVTGNAAGGIFFTNSSSQTRTLAITQSTLSGNSATGSAGALFMYTGYFYDYMTYTSRGSTSLVDINSSTITGNESDSDGNGGSGGGLWAVAYNLGSPLYNGDLTVTLANSIVSGNNDLSGVAPDIYDYAAYSMNGRPSYVSGRYSFIGDNSGSGFSEANPDGDGNKVGGPIGGPLNAMLGGLADNGGLTMTHLPVMGSPVIDMGDPATVGGTDQRGLARVVNGRVDMGSVEVQAQGINLDFNNDGMYNCGDMDLLEAAIDGGVYNAAFDVNADLVLNSQDVFDWLIDAGELRFGAGNRFLPGDANLNGAVDGSDFGIWNANKFTSASNWCLGDFNQSGQVDGSDFGIWNANKFMMSVASRPSDHGGTVLAARSRDVAGRVTSREVGERRMADLAASDRELRTKTPQAAATAIRVVAEREPLAAARQVVTSFDVVAPRTERVAALSVAQLSAIRSTDQAARRTSVGSSAIERVFAELEADDVRI